MMRDEDRKEAHGSTLGPRGGTGRPKSEIPPPLSELAGTVVGTEPIEDTDMHGHPRFYEILGEMAGLHSIKNHDYAAGGNPLGNFDRRARILAMYPGLDLSDPAQIAVIDFLKQLDAYLWFCSNGHEAKVEGKIERLKDVAVLSVLAMIMEERKTPATEVFIKSE